MPCLHACKAQFDCQTQAGNRKWGQQAFVFKWYLYVMPLDDRMRTFSLFRWVPELSGAALICLAAGSSARVVALRFTIALVCSNVNRTALCFRVAVVTTAMLRQSSADALAACRKQCFCKTSKALQGRSDLALSIWVCNPARVAGWPLRNSRTTSFENLNFGCGDLQKVELSFQRLRDQVLCLR